MDYTDNNFLIKFIKLIDFTSHRQAYHPKQFLEIQKGEI